MFGFGTQELLIVGGIVVLLFGSSKVAQLGKGLGEGIREFKSSLDGSSADKKQDTASQVASSEAA